MGFNGDIFVQKSSREELFVCTWCQSSVVCVMCSRLLFPYLVCFLFLISVIMSLVLSRCDCQLSCVFIFLSVQFNFIWSTHYSLVLVSVSTLPCPALPCLDILKTVITSSSACSSILPRACTMIPNAKQIY